MYRAIGPKKMPKNLSAILELFPKKKQNLLMRLLQVKFFYMQSYSCILKKIAYYSFGLPRIDDDSKVIVK